MTRRVRRTLEPANEPALCRAASLTLADVALEPRARDFFLSGTATPDSLHGRHIAGHRRDCTANGQYRYYANINKG
jgi:hypothetical protein